MGYFRRYKLSDYTADVCRDKMDELAEKIQALLTPRHEAVKLMEEWACFRELLARHEKNNQSPLDKHGE